MKVEYLSAKESHSNFPPWVGMAQCFAPMCFFVPFEHCCRHATRL